MRKAISLALQGGGYVNPNPRVGAVIVKNGRIIGEGWHAKYGDLHAERNALKNCTEDPKDAEIYVTLEPCCHYGKQPPCTEALLAAGIRKVYIGSRDPNPLVHGKGAAFLKEHGIEVEEDVLKSECDRLNPSFFHYISKKMPFVTLKYAMTLDGKISTKTGKSKWITGPEARKKVHEIRGMHTGILAGIGTVLADNPFLTCRDADGLNPVRIIADSHLRTPITSNIVQDIKNADPERSRFPRTILATTVDDDSRLEPYREMGCTILNVPMDKDGELDLPILMQKLGDLGIDSILLEGGGTLAWNMLREGFVQRICAFAAPKIFGGSSAKTPISGQGIDRPDEAWTLLNPEISIIGQDLLIEGDVAACLPE
ncbi:MAG: bifunctional diaminohydroxyphosphoribosylaminopyrimidine deaminase/5-amino-6-(5-phosphoribosylamino)uracil reductase RibD [Eubacteriales bacterium]|nr:bifunctional diaminohydroxyphosphoribosylaminopyrimidine deaminase/5-amino-6-(5-phosphoribosylamino)uracil reductase RibD [Eubacteriales bacterium]